MRYQFTEKRKPREPNFRVRRTRASIRRRRTYRLKTRTSKGHLSFKKVRTKQKMATIRRVATLKGLEVIRIAQ